MSVVSSETLPVVSESDIVTVRRRVREVTAQLGFGLVDQTMLVGPLPVNWPATRLFMARAVPWSWPH